ncbi:protein kinase domain-containing protein [Candidatus Uabimicrobium amorphum]|uniref:Serine/threonine protein kinase n=1 Tax=Uabimicrobium amorphum TaxID=2596890 RepID=A0A5S9IRK0_UABAM|nr:protein kinase [Candidatus Uabimicrobium amorphum]BBM86260.1 serine/threonine protein kinase [Candidatus Uabimicrobium amorphum]
MRKKELRQLWEELVSMAELESPDPGITYLPAESQVLQNIHFPQVSHFDENGMVLEHSKSDVDVQQTTLRRNVVIKKIKDDSEKDFFIQESLITAALEHPHISPIHELVEDKNGQMLLVMKKVKGYSWQQLLHSEKEEIRKFLDKNTISGTETPNLKRIRFHLDVLLKVCDAIAFAHSKGIIHNDLKPANVIVGDYGEVIVKGWGSAIYKGKESAPHFRTDIHQPIGTPSYMAPELVEGNNDNINVTTDVYLLGAILCEVVTHRPPHFEDSLWQTILSAQKGQVPKLKSDSSLDDQQLHDIFSKAMAKNPQERYQSVSSFKSAIVTYFDHRESIKIAEEAKNLFSETINASSSPRKNTSDLYEGLTTVTAKYSQALDLWPRNSKAQEGEIQAHLEYAKIAIANKEFNLAEVHLNYLKTYKSKDIKKFRKKLQKKKRIQRGYAIVKRRFVLTFFFVMVLGNFFAGALYSGPNNISKYFIISLAISVLLFVFLYKLRNNKYAIGFIKKIVYILYISAIILSIYFSVRLGVFWWQVSHIEKNPFVSLTHEKSYIRKRAAKKILSKKLYLKTEKVDPNNLIKALRYNDASINEVLMKVLPNKIEQKHAVPLILEIRDDNDRASLLLDGIEWQKVSVQQQTIEGLNNILSDNKQHFLQKMAAAKTLVKIKPNSPQVVPHLILLLKGGGWNIQHVAQTLLINMGEVAVPELTKALTTLNNSKIIAILTETLVGIGKVAVPYLITALKDSSGKRSRVLKILGRIGASEAVPAIILVFKDQDPSVRKLAIHTLEEIGEVEKAVPYLILALGDRNSEVREKATKVLDDTRENILPLVSKFIQTEANEATITLSYKALNSCLWKIYFKEDKSAFTQIDLKLLSHSKNKSHLNTVAAIYAWQGNVEKAHEYATKALQETPRRVNLLLQGQSPKQVEKTMKY